MKALNIIITFRGLYDVSYIEKMFSDTVLLESTSVSHDAVA